MIYNLQEIEKVYNNLIQNPQLSKNLISWKFSEDHHYFAIMRMQTIILIKCSNMSSQQKFSCYLYSQCIFSKNSQFFAYKLSSDKCVIKNLKVKSSSSIILKIPLTSEIRAFNDKNQLFVVNNRPYEYEIIDIFVYDLKTTTPLIKVSINQNQFMVFQINDLNGIIFYQNIYCQYNKLRIHYEGVLHYENKSIFIVQYSHKIYTRNSQTKKLLRIINENIYVYLRIILNLQNDLVMIIQRLNEKFITYSISQGKYFNFSDQCWRLIAFKLCLFKFTQLKSIR